MKRLTTPAETAPAAISPWLINFLVAAAVLDTFGLAALWAWLALARVCPCP